MTALSDYHIHTKWCHHATGEMQDYVKHGLKIGLGEMGFADHAPGKSGYNPEHRMDLKQFEIYVQTVQSLRAQFPEMPIKLGMETDFYPDYKPALLHLRNSFPMDYAIGSVHFIDDILVFRADESIHDLQAQEDYVTAYFSQLKAGLESGLVQVVAHFDVIKYGFPHLKNMIETEAISLLPLIQSQNMILELNAAGWRKRPQECYPSETILTEAEALGIPVCLSSDAHQPDHVGHGFDRALNLLKKIGYDKPKRHECGLQVWTT